MHDVSVTDEEAMGGSAPLGPPARVSQVKDIIYSRLLSILLTLKVKLIGIGPFSD